MSRTQMTLGGLLLVQVALILLVRSPFSGASHGAEARFFLPGLDAVSPVRLEIHGSGDEQITLTKDGDEWRVDEIGGFPADGAKIDGMIEDLEAVKVRRPVVRSSRYHKTFKVTEDENEGRLKIWDVAGDDPRVDLILGDSPNYRSVHARLAGEDLVYEIRGISTYDFRADATNWIEKELVDTPEASIVGLKITNASGTFELEKQDGSWRVRSPESDGERELDPVKVEALLRAATSVRLADAVGPVEAETQGLADPQATVVVRTGGEGQAGGELTLQIGGKVEGQETQRYITRAGFGFTGTIWESSVNKLLEGKLDELYRS